MLFLHGRGEDDRRVDPGCEAKGISSETTLDEDVANLERLRPSGGPAMFDGLDKSRAH